MISTTSWLDLIFWTAVSVWAATYNLKRLAETKSTWNAFLSVLWLAILATQMAGILLIRLHVTVQR